LAGALKQRGKCETFPRTATFKIEPSSIGGQHNMILTLRYSLCLAAILATTVCLSAQRKTKTKHTPAPVPVTVEITADTGNDDDKPHCFKPDSSRKLTFHIAVKGMSAGEATVELVDLGKMKTVQTETQGSMSDPNQSSLAKEAPFMESEVHTASLKSSTANVTFRDPGTSGNSVHLGEGPYIAMVSLARPHSKAVKPDLTTQNYLYYYQTWTSSKSGKCSVTP
jgi:hypothetical protein